ncbi:hypothetical protein PybrP1_008064 [[Pythium] brassicae (nom. inval.)]|nr:hypothetical protein PybrP1_008064 [[Pythium] brassicae (nom. inval.)]
MAAIVASNEKQIRAIQKLLAAVTAAATSSSTSSRRSAPLPRAVVDHFLQLPSVRAHSAAYLDAILRTGYKQRSFALRDLLAFLRGLPNPDHQLNGCWILREVDVSMPSSEHRAHSMALAFFVNELRQKLQTSPLKIRVDQFWHEWFTEAMRALVLGHSVRLETTATAATADERELLYAPTDKLSRDDPQLKKAVVAYRTQPEPQGGTALPTAEWKFVPLNADKSSFHIVNAADPTEYLCAASIPMVTASLGVSAVALEPREGTPTDAQSEWEIRSRGARDVVELFNRGCAAYLVVADADEDYDGQQRSVFGLLQNRASLNNVVARGWRLAAY